MCQNKGFSNGDILQKKRKRKKADHEHWIHLNTELTLSNFRNSKQRNHSSV